MAFPLDAVTGIVTYETAQKWITWLSKNFVSIRDKRQSEVNEISDVFGDPERLARYYVEPECQATNPADRDDEDPATAHRSEVWRYLVRFLTRSFRPEVRDGRNQLLIFADAGMGKTSLLVMLKFSSLTGFWPKNQKFELFKLGKDTLERISNLPAPGETVLLLDSLDEDPEAFGQVETRLRSVLSATRHFRQVIITCRTQFIPHDLAHPVEDPYKVEVGGFCCPFIFLAPFSDQQVEAYLRKVYPETWKHLLLRLLGLPDPNYPLIRAREVLAPAHSLRFRPMLLAYIEDLASSQAVRWNEYTVYKSLVEKWLWREERKEGSPAKESLERACISVALYLSEWKRQSLSQAQLEGLAQNDPNIVGITTVDIGGRSLLNKNSKGEWRFAHLSIQEFLCAEAIVRGSAALHVPRSTDLLLLFIQQAGGVKPGAGLDLSRAELGGRDLSHAVLIGARLHDANLSDANLTGADASGAQFRYAVLERASLVRLVVTSTTDLTGANLRASKLDVVHVDLHGDRIAFAEADLAHCAITIDTLKAGYFKEAKLGKAHLPGHLEALSLEGADLQGADLRGLNLERCCLRGCNLSGANLSGANLRSAVLRQTTLNDAILNGADLAFADLSLATGRCVQLVDADLSHANLTRVKFERAQLSRAKCRQSCVDFGICRDSDLRGADFSNASLVRVEMQACALDGSNFTRADLRQADLTSATGEAPLFAGARLRGARLPSWAGISPEMLQEPESDDRLYEH